MTGVPYYYNNAQPQVNRAYYPVAVNNPSARNRLSYSPPAYPWNSDMNAVMQSYILPVISKGPGYKELTPFKLPVLDTTARLYELDNGQAIAIIPKKGPTAIKTYVKTGSFNEGEYRGIRHFIEHSLFNGSKGLAPNEFVERVIKSGGSYNASTDTADTDYFIKSPLNNEAALEEYLTMHANMLMFPEFSDAMVEKEKGPVISEIQMYQDDPYDRAYNALIKNLFGIKTDYQGLIAGSSKTIQGLTKEIVQERYDKNYTPDKMLTVIVGDVDPEKVINIASPLFNRRKSPPVSEPEYNEPLNLTPKTVREDITSPHINACMTAMAFAGPQNNNIRETFASMGMLTALTGYENARLTRALKPYSSKPDGDISVLSSDFNSPQLIQVSANFEPGQQEQGLQTIYSTLYGMAYRPLSPQEMFIVKNKMKNNIASMSESSMGVADMLAKAVTGHGDIRAYTNAESYIDALTPRDIQNAAGKYLDLNRASIVVLHPQKSAQISFSGNSDQFKFNDIKEYDLPNNLRVIMNDNPWATKASVNIELRTDDIKTLKPGVADILSLMLKKGTRSYPEDYLNQIIDAYNLDIATGAGSKALGIGASCPGENLPLALGVIKEMLYNPDFSQEKFNRAKEELRLIYESRPKNPTDRAMEMLYPDYESGITPRKTLETLDQVTLNDVYNLYRDLIGDSQGVAVIDGPVSKTPGLDNAVFSQLRQGISFRKPYHTTPAPHSQTPGQTAVIAEAENRDQAVVTQVFKIKESGNVKDHAVLVLLNEVLGGNSNSRLFIDLREKQKLAYQVGSRYHSDWKYGNLALSIKTTTEDDLNGAMYDNLEKSLDGFRGHINSLITTPVGEEELNTAKAQVKKDISDVMEFSSARADRLQAGSDSVYGARFNNELVDAIDSLTPADVQNAAKLYLTRPSVISIIASPDTIKNTKPYLESLGNVTLY